MAKPRTWRSFPEKPCDSNMSPAGMVVFTAVDLSFTRNLSMAGRWAALWSRGMPVGHGPALSSSVVSLTFHYNQAQELHHWASSLQPSKRRRGCLHDGSGCKQSSGPAHQLSCYRHTRSPGKLNVDLRDSTPRIRPYRAHGLRIVKTAWLGADLSFPARIGHSPAANAIAWVQPDVARLSFWKGWHAAG